MEFENLLKLITAVSDSHLTQFSYEEDGTVIKMKTDKEQKRVTVNGIPQEISAMTGSQTAEPVQQTSQAAAREISGNVVTSPLVGTFCAASTPEDEPFVQVGDQVHKGQVLGIVEAMKLMNEIESEYDGVVKQILVSNEDVIEFGQPMFVIE